MILYDGRFIWEIKYLHSKYTHIYIYYNMENIITYIKNK